MKTNEQIKVTCNHCGKFGKTQIEKNYIVWEKEIMKQIAEPDSTWFEVVENFIWNLKN
jgi:hypothetical protein